MALEFVYPIDLGYGILAYQTNMTQSEVLLNSGLTYYRLYYFIFMIFSVSHK